MYSVYVFVCVYVYIVFGIQCFSTASQAALSQRFHQKNKNKPSSNEISILLLFYKVKMFTALCLSHLLFSMIFLCFLLFAVMFFFVNSTTKSNNAIVWYGPARFLCYFFENISRIDVCVSIKHSACVLMCILVFVSFCMLGLYCIFALVCTIPMSTLYTMAYLLLSIFILLYSSNKYYYVLFELFISQSTSIRGWDSFLIDAKHTFIQTFSYI